MTELSIIHTPSPNFDERTNPDGSAQSVDILMMHYTGMQTGGAALERMCDSEAKVSAHYMVEEDGRIFQLVDEEKRAWHAGVASWRGNTNINARSIGIEIVNLGHEWGYHEFSEAQIKAVISLSKEILNRHDIPARNVIGHSDVAPMRKQDPGELFPWQRLAAEGIGLCPAGVQDGEIAVSLGSEPLKQLHHYGYGISEQSSKEEAIAIMTAFQRHFRPSQVNGQWDAECENVLDALLEQV
jgi:N-acetylmuramoyl-L-alanine amidase